MDVESLAKQLILQNMTPEQQNAVLESVRSSLLEARNNQKRRVSENVGMVVDALKKIEADIRAKYDDLGGKIETRVNSIRDGRDGIDGRDGKDGKDGRPGRDGSAGPMGPAGRDGRDGVDGEDGVSVTDAKIDFDGSLIISLSNGREINVGEVVAPDLAERIKVITNGGGTSQTVIDALASLQAQIDALGDLVYDGTWNASTNTPTLASGVGNSGHYYIVSVAGTTNLNGITDWQPGDWAIFSGSVWQKIDQSNLVTSVNGQTGAVSLTTTDISEGTNQYYLDSRARSAISAGTGISYNSSTGVVTNSAPDQTVALTAGTGISTSGTYPNFTITNSAPDQVVGLTAGTGISTSGTYPNFTITNSAPDQTVALTAGTGISTSGTYPNFTITNSAPDQTVSLTGAGTTSVTGTYPNFTVTSNDQYVGTVTSVGGTGTVNGITLTGTVTSSGSLTLGGTLTGVDLTSQVTGTLPIANGGTGQTTRQAAMDALAGAVTAGFYLRGDGTDVVMSAIQAADVPTLNQNTTGTASNVTGTVAVVNGGTGQTSYTDGQLLIGNSTGNTLAKSTLTAGSGISITNGAGSITIAASGGGGSGTVTSVAAGAGMDFTTITTSGSVAMGTPSTITNTTSNSASGTTHSHALTGELVETTSGSPLYYGARAWVNFNGTGTVAIRVSANVSSITDNNTGDYTINFSTGMPDSTYVMHGSGSNSGSVSTPIIIMRWNTTAPTSSAARIGTTNDAGSAVDNLHTLISVFR